MGPEHLFKGCIMSLQFILRASRVAGVVLFAASASAVANAQVVVKGVLYDDANGARLRGTVMLVDPTTDAPIVHTATDSLGQFSLKTSTVRFQIAAIREGYKSVLSAPINAQSGESLTLNIPIAEAGDPQHNISVVEHVKPQGSGGPRPNGLTEDGMHVSDAERFQSRRAVGTGLHYTRKDFEKSNATTLGQFLQAIPGVTVRDPSSAASTQMTRSAGMTGLASQGAPGAACHVGWFMDGQRMDLPGRMDPLTDALGSLQLDGVSAIEVFRGLSEMPAEFAQPDLTCGAIAIWTKRG
jgi:hypothetical protein